jgi:signal transduction histidine kinase
MGLLNLTVITAYVYLKTRSTVLQRASNHMASASSLANQKLGLYFENLQRTAAHHPRVLLANPVLKSFCKLDRNRLVSLKGACPSRDVFHHLPSSAFTPGLEGTFLLRNDHGLYIFGSEGIDSLFQSREGLGSSGEIYLVDDEKRIRSASRFLSHWQKIKVSNSSVEEGLRNKPGVKIVRDYRNVEVISAHTPFRQDGMRFVVLSEIDWDEVMKPVEDWLIDLLKIGGLLLITSLGIGLLLTRNLLNLVHRLGKKIETLNSESAMRVIKAQEEEREKIAHTLHDSLGQYVTAMKWGIDHLRQNSPAGTFSEKLEQLTKLCESIIVEIRSISQDIMPSLIRDLGVFPAIKDYLHQQERLGGLKVSYSFSPEAEELLLQRSFQVNLYRMVQELLQNALKHSHASEITLNFSVGDEKLLMKYSDNGKGMPDGVAVPRSLNYRTQLFKGTMVLRSTKGLGYDFAFLLKDVTDGKN